MNVGDNTILFMDSLMYFKTKECDDLSFVLCVHVWYTCECFHECEHICGHLSVETRVPWELSVLYLEIRSLPGTWNLIIWVG